MKRQVNKIKNKLESLLEASWQVQQLNKEINKTKTDSIFQLVTTCRKHLYVNQATLELQLKMIIGEV